MKKLSITFVILLFSSALNILPAQGYLFTDVVRNPATTPKNQANTGTCWCYATTGFMESELLRTGKGEFDLAEMFIVYHNYMDRMEDNYLRRGKGNLGEGSVSHMFTKIFAREGIVPQEVYNGINYDLPYNDHTELNAFIKATSGIAVDLKKRSPEYRELVANVLDTYLGRIPEKFTYKGKEYTPKSFAASLGLNMDDYVEITSFSHIPFYGKYPLEIPDNWDHSQYYNLPLDEFMEVIDHALNSGYTVAWDGDVSERSFSSRTGVAVNPEVNDLTGYSEADKKAFENISPADRYDIVCKFESTYPEIKVDQNTRQTGFENFTTTDDHLMLLTGIAKDQNGIIYYITKNSYGPARGKYNGYVYMSESYVRAKSIAVMVHKNSIPAGIRAKLGI